ncbi:aminoglycoside phosphotransferase family protein [Deinococcus sonorensis]|uniref:Aminoglycoside phosphotransferase family protein n=2 Tax=Deinococcus sonorensis TaxID=309891 RepID=A0AAU7U8G3_9DEIO
MPDVLTALLRRNGLPRAALKRLARGATSEVYRAGEVVVRLGSPFSSFHADVAIRRLLLAAGQPVAEPLDHGTLPDGRPYALDRFVPGGPLEPAGTAQARQLGALLAALQRLPCTGYGLLHPDRDPLVGQARTPLAGLQTRLQDVWPLGASTLEQHPLTAGQPRLWPELERLRPDLLALADAPAVLNHTDLHPAQLHWDADGRLLALLDFGDAARGPAGWDVASFGYFHGWTLVPALLDGLEAPAGLEREAQLMGVLLAFHRASRATAQRRPPALEHARHVLRQMLRLLHAPEPRH